MAPRQLAFMNYNAGFWLGAVQVKKEEVEVGDVLILSEKRLSGVYPDVVEVRVMSVNPDETVTVIVRGGGGVENVKLTDLRRPDWWTTPLYWTSGGLRTVPRYRRPTNKDEMLKHGVALAGDCGIDVGHCDFMIYDFIRSMEEGIGYNNI